MRTRKPIKIYLPQKLLDGLQDYLLNNPPNFSVKQEYFWVIINHLLKKQIQFKNNEWNSINLQTLQSMTVTNIGRYVSLLKNGEFLISNNNYLKGSHSQKYRLNEFYIDDIREYHLDPFSRAGEKYIKHSRKSKAHYNRLEPHLKIMQEHFNGFDFNYESAYAYTAQEKDLSKKLNYLTAISSLKDKRSRYFKRNSTNLRLDTNFTNLKKEYRKFIIGDFICIDLKNSQPFLLCLLIDKLLNPRDILCNHLIIENIEKTFGKRTISKILKIHQNNKEENLVNFTKFLDSVTNGTLYEDFVEMYDGDLDRNDAKDIIFKIFFSKNFTWYNNKKFIPYREEKEVFASVYPFVAEIISELKERDNSLLPIFLQRLESNLFIDLIAKQLVENNIVPLTIHDSVIVDTKFLKETIEIMESVFNEQLGIVPKFDISCL